MSSSASSLEDRTHSSNITVDQDCDQKRYECSSDVHCWSWACLPCLRTCSTFAGIKVKLASLGDNHAVIVSNEGRVYSVGANDFGQLGLGDRSDRKIPREVGSLTEKYISNVVCGSRHSTALSIKGQVFCWGDSRHGQCGQGEKGIFTTPCKVNFVNRSLSLLSDASVSSIQKTVRVEKIACGDMHTLAVDAQGRLWCWGAGIATGLGKSVEEALVPEKVPKMQNRRVANIACGKFYSIALVQIELNQRNSRIIQDIGSPRSSRTMSAAAELNLPRTDSNVAQKIPFLENVFYVEEEEEGSIKWSMDLQKFPRSDKSPTFCEQEIESVEEEEECNNSSSDEEKSQLKKVEDTTVEFSADEIRRKSCSEDILSNPLIFENRLYELSPAGNFQDSDSSKRSSSCPSLDKTGASLKLSQIALSVGEAKDENDGLGDKDISSAPNRQGPISTNEIFFSACDIPLKAEKPPSLVEKDDNESSTISQDSSSKGPLNLSLNEGMENVILTQSCAVVYDETVITKDNPVMITNLMLSAKAATSPDGVDKIGSSVEIANSSQIWVWGDNNHGQLGVEGIQKSYDPVKMESLKDETIVKVAAGERHALALTSSCQVYGWGNNSCGQIGVNEGSVPKPRPIKILHNLRVWDISAGGNSSIFLADSANDICEMYHIGNNMKEPKGDFVSILHTSASAVSERKNSKKKKISLKKSKRHADSISAEWYIDADLQKVDHFNKSLILRSIVASDGQFACITESDVNQLLKIMHKLASSERNYFYQLSLIQDHVMTPLVNTETWISVVNLPGGEALLPLLDCFNDVLHSIRAGLWQLTDTITKGIAVTDLFSFFLSDSFRAVYDRYSKCFCDALAVGHLHSLSKAVSNIVAKLEESVKNVFHGLLLDEDDFAALLKLPLRRSSYYCKCVEKITRSKKAMNDSNEEEISQLLEVVQRWQNFADHTAKGLGEANQTKMFWDESTTKLIEALKDPHRRILKTNKDSSLYLARASRLTSHSFMLFNDVFVHSQSSRHFQVFPLVTLWADPLLDTDQQKYALRITAPEASFVLTANSHNERTEWLRELNEAIARCLSATSSHKITVGSVNSISGVLRAADAREAPYVYVNHPKYKGARYNGMWMSGVPYGRGKISWDNGDTYEGEFVNGNFHGYGIMVFSPSSIISGEDTYEGDWVDGKRNGYGKMSYRDGQEYVGHWQNDTRVGHGTLKSHSTDRGLQTIYIGDWLNDQKHGYGVQDFIVRGEKYIGMWQNNQRHGYGIVVTVDGVYCEGRFVQNKLAGKGILLSDDDTCYEGEFTADMQLSGKGVLTMPNGDYIEGQFHGNWGEGIKVNGTFNKFANPDPTMTPIGEIGSSQLSLTDFIIPAGLKWKSLFESCRSELGADSEMFPENVWNSIEKALIKTRSSDIRRISMRKRDFNKELSGVIRERRPKNVNSYEDIKRYLTEAIDNFGNPLNTLVEALVDVYRATYVGVGAHRRLLLHAVEEAKSYVSRLFTIVRLIFPSLPDEDFIILSNSRASGEDDKPVTSAMLLHPIILPRLYPPLFTLYALHTEKVDALYTERLHQLNKRGDVALMSFLGVDRKFLLVDFDEETKLPIPKERSPYGTAVQELETICTKYSPMEKIEALRRSFAKIHEEVFEFWKGKKKIVAMDDLFPVFQYVVTRARIAHLGSEIQFIEDLVERSVLVGELGHMLTTLRACFFQIQNEQDRG